MRICNDNYVIKESLSNTGRFMSCSYCCVFCRKKYFYFSLYTLASFQKRLYCKQSSKIIKSRQWALKTISFLITISSVDNSNLNYFLFFFSNYKCFIYKMEVFMCWSVERLLSFSYSASKCHTMTVTCFECYKLFYLKMN